MLTNLSVAGISLLSLEKCEKLPLNIRNIGKWWWLGTPGKGTAFIHSVCYDGGISSPGTAASANYLFVRPVLTVRENLLEAHTLFETVSFLGEDWCVISEHEMLHSSEIGKNNFNDNEAETTSNQYEGSRIQDYVNSWLKSKEVSYE